jgi:hypothetical protein
LSIYGSEQVSNVFGYWPDFHDAEVVRMSLHRTADYDSGPTIFMDVHVFEITKEVDEKGYFKLQHHLLVTFRFDGVHDVDLSGFNNQNALNKLVVRDIGTPAFPEPQHEVVLDAAHGVSATFQCNEIMVTAVTPWDPEARTPFT